MEQDRHADAIAFLAAMDLRPVDLLGFSIGSFVAQQLAVTRPDAVRRLVLASSAPQGAAGMHGWAPDVIGAVGHPADRPQEYLGVFFAPSPPNRPPPARRYSGTSTAGPRTGHGDHRATREARSDAVCTWGIPDHALLQRVELPWKCRCSWRTVTANR